MSGPVFNLFDDGFNVTQLNVATYNGFGGMGVLTMLQFSDSDVFDLYIGSKLRIKEQFSGVKDAPKPRGAKSERLVPVNSKVRP